MTPSKRLFLSLLYAFFLVVVLTGLGLAVQAFHYPLFPGIALAGAIFSSGVESDHRLRFEVAAVVFNTVLYALAIFFLLLAPRKSRRRRTHA